MEKIKNTQQILEELIHTHNEHNEQPYKKMRNFFYQDFLTYLSPGHQKLILKIYLKNQILNIIVKHQVAYQELNHDNTKFYIKKLIKDYVNFKPNHFFSQSIKENGGVKEVKIFFLKTPQQNIKNDKNDEEETNYHHIELSLGEFKNNFENKELHLKFEKIRALIKARMKNSHG